jgi:hypothetical protein
MNKISKIFLGILASALIISPSFAGELSVTGSAKASYKTNGTQNGDGKNIGVSNELDFSASGELDNGMTCNYQVQLDGASAANDDTRLEIGTDYGMIGIYNSEGGMSKELTTGAGALGVGFDYVSPSTFQTGYDVDGYSNIQYHTPADLLPFGAKIGLGYAPNMSAVAGQSYKGSTAAVQKTLGRSLEQINISIAPVDGLTIAGDAAQTEDETGAFTLSNGPEQGTSANLGAKYTMGQFTVGYTEGGYQPAVASGEVTYYENSFMGVQFDVNDAISVSFNRDISESNARAGVAAGATTGTITKIEMEQDSIQLAYTTGGATIGIALADVDNADYVAGKEEKNSVVSLAVAF